MSTLTKGAPAPHFTATDHKGQEISLEALRGKKVILYFYPKDDTPGCTAEACSFRDAHDELLAKGYTVIGVSSDSEKSHQKFATKYHLPFSLVADVNKELLTKYEAWGKKKFMGREYEGVIRRTFVINEEGTIANIIDKVDTKAAAAQILTATN
jgi:peroxiredoxin Q/BCP